MAENERATIRSRTRDGRAALARDGLWGTGAPPYGYATADEGRLTRHPDEAPSSSSLSAMSRKAESGPPETESLSYLTSSTESHTARRRATASPTVDFPVPDNPEITTNTPNRPPRSARLFGPRTAWLHRQTQAPGAPEWLRPSAAAYARQRAPLPAAYVVPGGSGACVRFSMPRRLPASPLVTPRDPTGSALGRRARRIAARPHQLIRRLLPSHSAHVDTHCLPAARARAFGEPS